MMKLYEEQRSLKVTFLTNKINKIKEMSLTSSLWLHPPEDAGNFCKKIL